MKSIKRTLYILLAIPALFLTSCETEVPLDDTTSPELGFTINGPGISQVFSAEDNWSTYQVNILAGATYSCTFLGGDPGGVSEIQWRLFSDLDLSDVAPAETESFVSGLSRTLRLLGDEGAPLTAQIITTDMKADNNLTGVSFNMTFGSTDYSGNNFFDQLQFLIVDSEPQVIETPL